MNCSICTYLYKKERKPLSLPCGHSFCSDCMKQGSIFTCKSCGKSGSAVLNTALYNAVLQSTRNKDIDKFIKVCFFGQSSVGKTSSIKRLVEDDFVEKTTTTIGLDFTFKDIKIDDKNIRLQLWDSAGQQQYRAITSTHYKNSDVVVLIFDLTAPWMKNQMGYWIEQIEDFTDSNNVIVVGNKLDMANEKEIQQSILQAQKQSIMKHKWKYIHGSCKTGENFDKIWQYVKGMCSKCKITNQKFSSKIIDSKTLKRQTYKPQKSKIKTQAKSKEMNTIKQIDDQRHCPCLIM